MCQFGMDTLSWARYGAEVTGVDISDKSNPNRIGNYDTGEQRAAEVSSIPELNLVFVAEFEKGLEIFNVSDPSNPKKINSYSNCFKF